MANDADQIVVGASGQVYVGPVGTALPTTPTAALNVAFIDLGYISEDGVEWTPTVEANKLRAWQSFNPVRTLVTARDMTIGFSLLEWSKTTIPLAFGGGTVTTPSAGVHKYVPPDGGDTDPRAMIVEFQDGTKNYRLIIPRGSASDLGASTLTRGDASALPISFEVEGTDGTDPWYLLTDDPAFA